MEEGAHLQSGSLTFIEVLAVSVALIGPSMTPILIAPFMFQEAGNGTWLAYVFGAAVLAFVALNINQFARRSSAAGSMYGYVADHLGGAAGALNGWALLWAYGFVATAVLGAMGLFGQLLLADAGVHVPPLAIVPIVAIIAWQAAYRGVQISAIVMLVLELISVGIICWIVAVILAHHGFTVDTQQLRVAGGFPSVGLALAFAMFSFVGVESATAFGAEAKQPLITIPRAVLGSVLFAGVFFIVTTYAEILGFRGATQTLDKETFPLGTLAGLYGVDYLRVPITIGAMFSAFSVCLACITTGGRIAYAMSRTGAIPATFGRIEPKHDTPNVAVTVVTAIALVIAAAALEFGVAPIDVFNNCGTLSSFGFILAYGLISIAAGVYVKRLGERRFKDVAVSAIATILLVFAASTLFYPVPDPPQRYFAYYFLAFLAAGWIWFALRRQRSVAA